MPVETPMSVVPVKQWGLPNTLPPSAPEASWQSVVTPRPPAPRSKWALGPLKVAATAEYQVRLSLNLCLYEAVTMSAWLLLGAKEVATPSTVRGRVASLCCPGSPGVLN